jgi:hypothetical protein
MKNDIRNKLQGELIKQIEGEPQVVYILSRIRKIIEIDKKEDDYAKLKFYCDWALHSKINNVGAMREILDGIIARDGKAGMDLTMQFDTLHGEIKRFLKEYGLSPFTIPKKILSFSINSFPKSMLILP